MRNRFFTLLMLASIVALTVLSIIPTNVTQARVDAKQITITITEAQFAKYVASVRARGIKKTEVDIVDGGIIVKFITSGAGSLEVWEHFGVLIRDGKLVTEAGVISFPAIGQGLGYADAKNLVPEIVPYLDHDAKIMSKFVLRQVAAKAGSRYTPESATLAGDKLVIVVNK